MFVYINEYIMKTIPLCNEHYVTSCVHSIHHFLYIIIARICLHFKLYSMLYQIMCLYNLDEVNKHTFECI